MAVPLEAIRKAVSEVARQNGARLAVLFGSYARGTATDRSDIDVIFVGETDLPFLKRLDLYMDPLTDRLNTNVETLVYTPREFEEMRERPFVRRALEEGIVIYES